MRKIGFTLACSVCLAAGAGLPAAPATAQTPGSIVGVVGGWVVNEQVWQQGYQTEAVGGAQLGGFLNAATPVSWFRMRAEFMWTQRGGSVSGTLDGAPLTGETRTDYLTIGIQPRVSIRLGRAEVFTAAGPMMDLVVRNRFGPELAVAVQETATAYGVGAGIGLGARVHSAWRAEIEARVFEGLGDAYDGAFISARNRSFGVVVRVGRPLRR